MKYIYIYIIFHIDHGVVSAHSCPNTLLEKLIVLTPNHALLHHRFPAVRDIIYISIYIYIYINKHRNKYKYIYI